MKLQQNRLASITATAALLLTLIGCQPQESPETTSGEGGQPGVGVTVTPAYSVLEELFQTEIVNIGLEELGYEIASGKEIEYATMHVDLANGGIDYTAVHWERLHSDFYQESGGDERLERLGVLVDNVLQGYLIDKATAEEYNITTIDRLRDPEIAALFDTDGDGKANLTGCNPGWGCELVIEHHLDEYGLRDTVQHDQGQYFALMADTITRFEQGEPILYYTWTPLWVSGILAPGEEVVWLEVPYTSLPEEQGDVPEEQTTVEGQNLGFAIDRQRILSNDVFIQENPAARQFFELVSIPRSDISTQNQRMRKGEDSPEDIRRHAEEWVAEHRTDFEGWLEEARQATQQASD